MTLVQEEVFEGSGRLDLCAVAESIYLAAFPAPFEEWMRQVPIPAPNEAQLPGSIGKLRVGNMAIDLLDVSVGRTSSGHPLFQLEWEWSGLLDAPFEVVVRVECSPAGSPEFNVASFDLDSWSSLMGYQWAALIPPMDLPLQHCAPPATMSVELSLNDASDGDSITFQIDSDAVDDYNATGEPGDTGTWEGSSGEPAIPCDSSLEGQYEAGTSGFPFECRSGQWLGVE